MSKRDERLTALESEVKNAEKKLKNAEMTSSLIADKLKTREEAFAEKFRDTAEKVKAQTGADFVRVIDENGRVEYKLERAATSQEKKKGEKSP